ncbi:TMED1 isoform 1 [Pongo abelii]|uniref:TMED1 isoform 1 n=1 Tax=Pongo abelii TaxID=9601 RepID=A0A2J8S0S9_PONAB|nr:TMED1 isoform 1 [Pongo abelii]
MMAAGAALALALWLLMPPVGVGGAGPPPIQDGEFTFLLPAGRKQCFYQSAPANASLETEYQVIGGAGLDVDFTLESPQGVLLVSESRKADGVHTSPLRPCGPGWSAASRCSRYCGPSRHVTATCKRATWSGSTSGQLSTWQCCCWWLCCRSARSSASSRTSARCPRSPCHGRKNGTKEGQQGVCI